MKKLLILLLFTVGCTSCPTPKPRELSYVEKMEKMQLAHIDSKIDKIKDLKKEERKIMKEYVRCVRSLIPNYHTVSNLMEWQNKALHVLAENSCSAMMQSKE